MLTEPTLDRLRALHLGAMADAYRAQLQDPGIGALSFDERVGLLVEAEHLSRDNRKLTRRLKEAKLRIPNACLEVAWREACVRSPPEANYVHPQFTSARRGMRCCRHVVRLRL